MPYFSKSTNGGFGAVGIMQIYDPAPLEEQIWNWRENIKAGYKLYNKKKLGALSLCKNELSRINKRRSKLSLPLCKSLSQLTNDQLERETIRRYNCGTEYRWEDMDSLDCSGKWVIDPSCRIEKPKAYDPDYVDKVLNCDINK